MAAMTGVEPLFRGNTSKNTRGLLRIIILCTIAAAAISARLFSVIRMPCCPPILVTQMDELSADSSSTQDLRVSYMNVRVPPLGLSRADGVYFHPSTVANTDPS